MPFLPQFSITAPTRHHAGVLWLVVGGEGSTPSLVALSSVTILLLSALAYVKNRLLATTSEPDRRSEQKESFMNKAKTIFSVSVASVLEVALALGAGHQAVAGPLAKVRLLSAQIPRPLPHGP